MNCDILERRLVRLWPFAERRTRGNGALGAIIDIPDKDEVILEKICNGWFDKLLTKVAGYPPSKIPGIPPMQTLPLFVGIVIPVPTHS